jgi:hypothetical protein
MDAYSESQGVGKEACATIPTMNRDHRRIKVVGHRKPPSGANALAAYLRLLSDLRAGRYVLPGGIRQVQTVEEARKWAMRLTERSGEGESPPLKS